MVLQVLTLAMAVAASPPCAPVSKAVPSSWVRVRLASTGLVLAAPTSKTMSLPLTRVVDAVIVDPLSSGVAISEVPDSSAFGFTFNTPAEDTTAVCHVAGRVRQTEWRVFPYDDPLQSPPVTPWAATARIPVADGRVLVVAVSAPTRVRLGHWIRSVANAVDRADLTPARPRPSAHTPPTDRALHR